MAVASWMLGKRGVRSRYNRRENDEDNVKLDLGLDDHENAKNILTELLKTSNLSEGKRLNYLNAFVKLVLHTNGNLMKLGYTTQEILLCLRVSTVHETTQVRSGGFRAVRHVVSTEEDIHVFNKLLFPFLVARSLDLVLKNDIERIEAMKLMRKVLFISSSSFDVAMCRSLVSLANGGIEDKDRMLRVCLATLSELCVLNSELFISCGGVAAITRNLLECQTPKISESLCGVLLMLLDRPITRNEAAVDLHCVAVPYCDFHYRNGWMDKNRDERELRFNCSRLALLTMLRSWPGILHFCSPNDRSGFKAIVDILYLNQLEVRKAVLDLLYELLGLPQPEWTDELSVALIAVDPAEPQASWRINEGFVAAEGSSVLPHLAQTTPSITDMHLSLLLYCFYENGLLKALAQVIVTSDTFISVRATVLLGELLRLIQIMLPSECCNVSPALPNLLEYAVTNKPQALRAVTALQQLHELLQERPASYSLYLDYILQSGHFMKKSMKFESYKKYKISHTKSKLTQLVLKDNDDEIKDTGVLSNKDPSTWNWNLIKVIVKNQVNLKLDMANTYHRNFLKRLTSFYIPSSNRYSHMDLRSPKTTQGYTIVGVDLIHRLQKLDDPFASDLLDDLFKDISRNIVAIYESKSPHECFFSPQHMVNTQCQSYFLFIGRLGSNRSGVELLTRLKIFEQLEHLTTTTNHSCYVKLVISSLDYSESGPARNLLSAVLMCPTEGSRLYATQFLLVLLRAGIPDFCDWGVKLLATQLKDTSRTIYLSALSTLHEACEIPSCIESLVKINPNVLHLGDKGVLLLIRYLSIPSGFNKFMQNDFILNEIKRWDEQFNFRYVNIVERETSDTLTLHQRGEDGRYDKRVSSNRSTYIKETFIPPHLYGQLSRHNEGFQLLLQQGSVASFVQYIESGACETEQDILNIKTSLWALGHLGSSTYGSEFLSSRNILPIMVNLAETSVVYSIKATAFYCLGLIATTKIGADSLFKLNWLCARHTRHERWPIIEEENWDEENPGDITFPMTLSSDSERTSSDKYFTCNFLCEDVDSNTTDDDIPYIGDSTYPSEHKKSSTLPNNQSSSTIQHKRSLSESKTFELIKGHESKNERLLTDMPHRYRDNSVTESITSGVSSCESVIGKCLPNEKVPTLSPIPSSSSFIAIKIPTVKIRRHSESSRGVSLQSVASTDKSTISPSSSSRDKLSYQDLKGYVTMRSIRQQLKSSDDEISERSFNDRKNKVYSLDPNRRLNYYNDKSGQFGNFIGGLSLSSLSSMHKFSVKETPKVKGQCYRGICLPMKLINLFTDCHVNARRLSLSEKNMNQIELDTEDSLESSLKKKSRNTKHNSKFCFNCSQVKQIYNLSHVQGSTTSSEVTDTLTSELDKTFKVDILKHVERLGNPILMKMSKQALLQYKQKSPHLFQNLCLYSEICVMISENAYRLNPRRLLQELFIDTNFEALRKTPQYILSQVKSVDLKETDRVSVEHQPVNYTQSAMEQRRLELSFKMMFNTLISHSTSKGNFDVHMSEEKDQFSPMKFEPRSPPLAIVTEENMTSTENLLADYDTCDGNAAATNIQITVTTTVTDKTESKSVVKPNAIKTLDALKFTYKENKFPIKNRDDSKKCH